MLLGSRFDRCGTSRRRGEVAVSPGAGSKSRRTGDRETSGSNEVPEIPNHYWATLVEKEKFVIDWQNIEEFLIETEDFRQLVPIFRSPGVVSALAKDQRKIDSDLFDLLVGLDEMRLESYQKLVGPGLGEIAELPTSIERDKKLHLIRSGMIGWSQNAYDWLAGSLCCEWRDRAAIPNLSEGN